VTASYSLTLTCVDQGSPSLTGHTDLEVFIIDENDHNPVFVDPGTVKVIVVINLYKRFLLFFFYNTPFSRFRPSGTAVPDGLMFTADVLFFFRHAFSEIPRSIALKLCHMVGIWLSFIN